MEEKKLMELLKENTNMTDRDISQHIADGVTVYNGRRLQGVFRKLGWRFKPRRGSPGSMGRTRKGWEV